MRLVELRLLDGPNVYRLEPTVKLEVGIGRRRTWYGQRLPGTHARVRLGAPVPRHVAPGPVRDLAVWVGVLHRLSAADGWLVAEGRAAPSGRVHLPVGIHRTSEPGAWVIAFPWREEGRARAVAEAALRLVELDLDPHRTRPATRRTAGRPGRSRTLARAIRAIREADTRPPAWIRDTQRRVPTISISGTNGKTTTTRLIAHILMGGGRHVGTTTSDGVLFDERLVEAGDLTGPYGARSVLLDPRVDVAVLETARGGMVLRGVGYESNDASVLTNISSDHMDLQGIHTLPELVELKSVIARITRHDGVAVLNADDPLVAGVARSVRAPVWWCSLDASPARLRRLMARGGRAFVLQDGWLVELEGGERRPILEAREIPVTIDGLARHNIANALAAAAGARAMGATLDQVAAGLRSFGAEAGQRNGRLDLYRKDATTVIVDFAHNEAGVQAVLDVASGLADDRSVDDRATGRRAGSAGQRQLTIVIGTAGDRPDDTLRGIGRIAAINADRVVIKETVEYLRGRTPESVIGELRAGITIGGGDGRHATVYPDEASAVRGELDPAGGLAPSGSPGVLVVMCHEDRAGVITALTERGFEPV